MDYYVPPGSQPPYQGAPYVPPPPEPPLGAGLIVALIALALLVPLIGPIIALIYGVANHKRQGSVALIVAGALCFLLLPVLGIIASISIPLLLSARNNAVNEKARNVLRMLVSAEAAYYASTGSYGDFKDLRASSPPYIDARFDNDPVDLGQNIQASITVSPDGKSYHATVTGTTHDYSADESGTINESLLPWPQLRQLQCMSRERKTGVEVGQWT